MVPIITLGGITDSLLSDAAGSGGMSAESRLRIASKVVLLRSRASSEPQGTGATRRGPALRPRARAPIKPSLMANTKSDQTTTLISKIKQREATIDGTRNECASISAEPGQLDEQGNQINSFCTNRSSNTTAIQGHTSLLAKVVEALAVFARLCDFVLDWLWGVALESGGIFLASALVLLFAVALAQCRFATAALAAGSALFVAAAGLSPSF